MSEHIISQEIIDGLTLLGLPVEERSYNDDPEKIIFAYTSKFNICTCFTQPEPVKGSYSSSSEALHAKLGHNS